REVLHEPNVVTRGDRGSAYASAAETRGAKVVFASGQGEGKRAIVMFDPRWLEETEQRDELESGPVHWTQYGGEGLRVETGPGAAPTRAAAIPLGLSGLCGASWNFPLADSGEISLRIRVPSG